MRIPHINKYHLEKSEVSKSAEIEVSIEPNVYLDDLGLFDDKKEYIQWVIRMKKMIRDSYEYHELISFLKRKHGMDGCGVHPNLTVWNGFRIELHHTPFCLEDIVHIVTNKRKVRNESMKMTDIAHEIMELHYLGLVGLYPLCPLCHGYAHPQGSHEGDDLFIPIDNVYGDPVKFYELYGEFSTEGIRTKWNNILQLNKGYTLITQNIPIELQKKYIYIKPKDKSGSRDLEVVSTVKLADFINEVSRM